MKSRFFFNGLNELRAFAALAVVFHHIELYKNRLGVSSLYDSNWFNGLISKLGENGVFTFFVLSGFLITFLLLKEKSETGNISIKLFYIRRILRIWPLYFLILIIGFFVLPFVYSHFSNFFYGQSFYNSRIEALTYGPNLLMFVFFLSNVSLSLYGPVAGASQSWSVSVEEQFYLIWPWIVKTFSKYLLPVFIFIIFIVNFLQWTIGNTTFFEQLPGLKAFVKTFHVDFMAMGAMFAWVYSKDFEKVNALLRNRITLILSIVLVLAQLIFPVSHLLFSFSVATMILCFIEHKVTIKVFNFFGKISYGIYMYHPVIMYFTFSLAKYFGIKEIHELNIFVYPVIIGITTGISYLSYQYIESFFLKRKDSFSHIKSGSL